MAMWQWKLHLFSLEKAFAVTGTLEANVPVVTKEEFFRLDPEHPFKTTYQTMSVNSRDDQLNIKALLCW